MYVGQAGIRDNGKSFIARMNEHLTNKSESYWGKWEYIAVIVNEKNDWGSTELDALEYLFWSMIPVGNRYNSKLPSSNGADLSLYTDIVNQTKSYLNKMQFTMFLEDTKEKTTKQVNKIISAKSDKPIDLSNGTTKVPDITTPEWVVKKMIAELPQELFDNPDTKFIDPACKAGEYLEAIYKRCSESEVHRSHFKDSIDPESFQKMHIINNQIYGISLTPNSFKLVTTGKMKGAPNIRFINNYVNKVKQFKLKDILEEEFGRMKFDVVIGNPPYNEAETKQSTAVYGDFVLNLRDCADYISFITPARWYSGGRGKNLPALRNELLNKGRLRTLVDFPNKDDVFKDSVNINGGVCYYLWDKNYNGECNTKQIIKEAGKYKTVYDTNRDIGKYPVFIRDNQGLNIIEKVIEVNNGNYFLGDIGVQAVDCFNVKDNPFVHGYRSEGDINIVDSSGYLYAKREYLNNPHLIDCYNVIVTHAIGGEGYVIPNTVRILDIGEACSVTYLCVGGTTDYKKAEYLLKYIKSKLVRFLVLQTITGQNISANSFRFVPLQQFDSTDGIAWSNSIEDIDRQLYKKYNLTPEEINYIEKKIKPMLTLRDAEAALINKKLTQ